MGLLDGILGGVIGAEALSLVKDYIEKRGGIQGVVAEFEKTGFGQQAKSWVSTGPNLPITAEQMHQALGLAFRSKALKLAHRWPSETSPENTVHHMNRLVTTTPANMSCRHLLFALKSETRKTGGNIVLT